MTFDGLLHFVAKQQRLAREVIIDGRELLFHPFRHQPAEGPWSEERFFLTDHLPCLAHWEGSVLKPFYFSSLIRSVYRLVPYHPAWLRGGEWGIGPSLQIPDLTPRKEPCQPQ